MIDCNFCDPYNPADGPHYHCGYCNTVCSIMGHYKCEKAPLDFWLRWWGCMTPPTIYGDLECA